MTQQTIIVLDIPMAVTHSQTLFNSANFQNGSVLQLQDSLAGLSAVVIKGCLID